MPDGIAAVIATMRSLSAASATRACENASVKLMGAPGLLCALPVSIENGAMPWNASGESSACT